MLELGTPAPEFHLLDVVSHQTRSLETFASHKVLLVMFICRHCPFVRHIQHELARLGKDYGDKNVAMIAISANDASVHPQDSPESLREMGLCCKKL